MENAVKDGILTGESNDPVLSIILSLATSSEIEGRPLFPNPMQEPAFYRWTFKKWVAEGINERKLTKTPEK